MKLLLSLINKLYGSKAIQKTIGTRTNVITLPNKQTKQLLNEQLNVNQASDQQILKLKDDIEKLIPDIPKMNDSEVLNLTSNLQKIDNRLNPPQAEIIEMGTKQPVSPAGIKQLEAERGMPENVDPNSPLGIIMQRVKKAELESKSIAEEFGMENVLKKGLDDLMRTQTGYPSIQREGMVRTAVREIMTKDLKSGKLKIKDPEVKRNLEKYISSGEDPIETFRKYYGEDRLADIDDVAEELLPAQSYTEIQDILKQKKLYDLPVKKKGAGEYDPAIKEGEKITKNIEEGKIKPMNVTPAEDIIEKGDFDPSGMATGGRVGFSQGKLVGKGITKLLERFAKDKKKSRLLTDDEIEEFAEELGDTETWMSSGTLKEAEEAAKRRKDYEQQMYSEYQVDKQGRKELEQAYKEIDFRMTGEDTKYEANELADMLAETRYKTEMSDLPQKTQLDLYDEAYNYLMEVKRDATNFKGAVDIKSGKNIVTGEQELPLDSMTGKPRKLNATGGRVGFAEGSDPESYDVPTESPLKISGNFSKSKKSEILDYVASLEIPVSEKIKLIGELTGVNSSFKDEYGKYKYQDLMKSVGLNYNEGGEGLSAAFRHNVDTGKNDAYFQYKMPFAKGGRVGFSDGGNEALLEQLYEKFLDLGLSPKDAADAARKEFEQRARKAGGGIAYLMGL
jgi:hypothetical protein